MTLGLLSGTLSTPQRLTWSAPVQIPVAAGLAGALAGVDHDCMIIAGGTNFPVGMPWDGGKKKYYDDIYVLAHEASGGYRWLLRAGQRLPEPLAYSACVTSETGIVCVGGENERGPSKKVWRMIWDAGQVKIERLPDLPLALTNASATVLDGLVYVAGGETHGGVSDGFYCLENMGWRALSSLPKALSHAVLSAGPGRIYLAGGRCRKPDGISELSAAVYYYDVADQLWVERPSLPYPLSAGTGMVYRDKLYLFGGDRGEVFHRTEELIAAIQAEKDIIHKRELIMQKTALQQTHPGFSKEVLMYDDGQDKWIAWGHIPFPSPVTTTVFRWKDRFVIPGGEVRAGVRTSQILIATFEHE